MKIKNEDITIDIFDRIKCYGGYILNLNRIY